MFYYCLNVQTGKDQQMIKLTSYRGKNETDSTISYKGTQVELHVCESVEICILYINPSE